MSSPFTPPDSSPYTPGSLFLGTSDTGQEIGIKTDRHAITVAGSRSGKGSALIVPNLFRWPHSALVIDPKGENAHLTWEAREALGQTVHVLDPFREADIPDRLRSSFNPLATINPAALSAREDISVIADGLVIRHKADDGEWYDGAVSLLAGFIAHAVTTNDPAACTLGTIRDLLNLPPLTFQKLLKDMHANPACGGLAETAANLCMGATKSTGEMLAGARRSIDKMGSDALRSVMGESTFDLAALKSSRTTVFLVLPSRYVEEHARFFRLFVRMALNIMESPLANKSGLERMKGTPCLFILDEFYSLGRIDAIQKAAGRMAGNGVHLWPFVQDIGQLTTLYGSDGAHTYFSNAAAQIFFENTDSPTLDYVSNRLGKTTVSDMPLPVVTPYRELSPGPYPPGYDPHASSRQLRQQEIADYRYITSSMVGKARLPPDEIAKLTSKGPGDRVARSMIAFVSGGRVFNLRLAPYYATAAAPAPPWPTPNLPALTAPPWQGSPRPAPATGTARYGKSLMVTAGLGLLVLVPLAPSFAPLALVLAAFGWARNRHERSQLAGG